MLNIYLNKIMIKIKNEKKKKTVPSKINLSIDCCTEAKLF